MVRVMVRVRVGVRVRVRVMVRVEMKVKVKVRVRVRVGVACFTTRDKFEKFIGAANVSVQMQKDKTRQDKTRRDKTTNNNPQKRQTMLDEMRQHIRQDKAS
jgi:hypothetical protein